MSQYPAVQAGMRVTAGLLQQMLWYDASKDTATSRSLTTTLAADPDLAIAVPAGGTWQFEAFLNYTGGPLGASDLKIAMAFSGTSANSIWGVNGIATGAVTQANFDGRGVGTGSSVTVGTNGGNFLTTDLRGVLYASTSGVLALYWAQNASHATATNVRPGCYLRARRIA